MAERQTGAYQTTVRTQEKGSKDNLLSIRSQEGERIAMKVLTPTALKIYLYATSNANGYHFLLCSIYKPNHDNLLEIFFLLQQSFLR